MAFLTGTRLYFLFISLVILFFSACNNDTDRQMPEDEFIRTASADVLNERAKELSKEIEKKPNAELYFRRAKIYEALKQLELAKDDVEQMLSLDSTKAEYFIFAGNIYEKLPYTRGALLAYESAVKLQPENKDLLLKLGEMFYYVKNREKSFQYLNAAIKIDKYLPKAYYYRGLNFKEMDRFDNAVRSFQTAVEADPGYFDAYMQLGLMYAEKKDPKSAAYYGNAINLKPEDPRAYYGRGMYYQSIDSNHLAIKDFEKIVEMDPGDFNTQYNLGYNYYLLKDYNKAITHFTLAIEAEDKYKEAYYGRSLAYKALGKTKEANEDLKRSNELKPLYGTDEEKAPKPGEKANGIYEKNY